MLYTQGRAEKAWISGEIESAHMQQFYAVMALRTPKHSEALRANRIP